MRNSGVAVVGPVRVDRRSKFCSRRATKAKTSAGVPRRESSPVPAGDRARVSACHSAKPNQPPAPARSRLRLRSGAWFGERRDWQGPPDETSRAKPADNADARAATRDACPSHSCAKVTRRLLCRQPAQCNAFPELRRGELRGYEPRCQVGEVPLLKATLKGGPSSAQANSGQQRN